MIQKQLLKKIRETITEIQSSSQNLLDQNIPLGGEGGKLYVIKIGGNIIDDEEKLSLFLKDFASIKEKKILIHGGGKLATNIAQQLNIPQQIIDGRRITDAETLKVITMVYAGYINKNITASLQSNNCNAVGLCGADGNLIQAHKRTAKVLSFGEDLGEVLIQQVKSNHMETILNLQQVSKTYKSGSRVLAVLDNVSFSVQAGSALSIVGPSGSGKTTLLGLCAGLDRSSSGNVELQHMQLEVLNEDQLASVRNKYVGFIFQNFQLMPTLTALENVMVPLELRGEKKVRARSMDLLDKVGLADRSHHYPAQLSGGEQQRVSIARAFANRPRILFADEPTGNLDAETSGKIVNLIFDLNKEAGTTLLLVTHNAELAARTQRIIHLKGGKIVADKPTTATV